MSRMSLQQCDFWNVKSFQRAEPCGGQLPTPGTADQRNPDGLSSIVLVLLLVPQRKRDTLPYISSNSLPFQHAPCAVANARPNRL